MKRKPVTLATEQRGQHNKLALEANNPIERKARHRVVDQINIDRLLLNDKINHDQWVMAEKILKLGHAAGMAGGVLESNLSKLVIIDGSTTEKLSFRYDARDKLHTWLKHADKAGGSGYLTYLVCIEDMSPTAAAQKIRLRNGLQLFIKSIDSIMSIA
jgi:hypothetical protein